MKSNIKEKICKTCRIKKEISEFYPKNGGYFTGSCKICLSEKQKLYPKSRKKYSKEYHRERSIINNYNITKKEYDILYKEQGGKCAICGIPETELKRNFSIDHDHKTGKVRGLLCNLCNQGLGSFKDNQSNVENALYYLILHK